MARGRRLLAPAPAPFAPAPAPGPALGPSSSLGPSWVDLLVTSLTATSQKGATDAISLAFSQGIPPQVIAQAFTSGFSLGTLNPQLIARGWSAALASNSSYAATYGNTYAQAVVFGLASNTTATAYAINEIGVLGQSAAVLNALNFSSTNGYAYEVVEAVAIAHEVITANRTCAMFSPLALFSNMITQAVVSNNTATANAAIAAGYAYGCVMSTATTNGLLEASSAKNQCGCPLITPFLLGAYAIATSNGNAATAFASSQVQSPTVFNCLQTALAAQYPAVQATSAALVAANTTQAVQNIQQAAAVSSAVAAAATHVVEQYIINQGCTSFVQKVLVDATAGAGASATGSGVGADAAAAASASAGVLLSSQIIDNCISPPPNIAPPVNTPPLPPAIQSPKAATAPPPPFALPSPAVQANVTAVAIVNTNFPTAVQQIVAAAASSVAAAEAVATVVQQFITTQGCTTFIQNVLVESKARAQASAAAATGPAGTSASAQATASTFTQIFTTNTVINTCLAPPPPPPPSPTATPIPAVQQPAVATQTALSYSNQTAAVQSFVNATATSTASATAVVKVLESFITQNGCNIFIQDVLITAQAQANATATATVNRDGSVSTSSAAAASTTFTQVVTNSTVVNRCLQAAPPAALAAALPAATTSVALVNNNPPAAISSIVTACATSSAAAFSTASIVQQYIINNGCTTVMQDILISAGAAAQSTATAAINNGQASSTTAATATVFTQAFASVSIINNCIQASPPAVASAAATVGVLSTSLVTADRTTAVSTFVNATAASAATASAAVRVIEQYISNSGCNQFIQTVLVEVRLSANATATAAISAGRTGTSTAAAASVFTSVTSSSQIITSCINQAPADIVAAAPYTSTIITAIATGNVAAGSSGIVTACTNSTVLANAAASTCVQFINKAGCTSVVQSILVTAQAQVSVTVAASPTSSVASVFASAFTSNTVINTCLIAAPTTVTTTAKSDSLVSAFQAAVGRQDRAAAVNVLVSATAQGDAVATSVKPAVENFVATTGCNGFCYNVLTDLKVNATAAATTGRRLQQATGGTSSITTTYNTVFAASPLVSACTNLAPGPTLATAAANPTDQSFADRVRVALNAGDRPGAVNGILGSTQASLVASQATAGVVEQFIATNGCTAFCNIVLTDAQKAAGWVVTNPTSPKRHLLQAPAPAPSVFTRPFSESLVISGCIRQSVDAKCLLTDYIAA
ncbi:hypothetical protein WJX72_008138 [[Myrmecia] bisecta]|uniref:Uncharacterized protein n=1 Tax=[Myrmecia] bisecta TaxID=41462 RepID=A0AAW1PAY5_9CHLO